jgi:hypothetical protein
MNEALTSDAAVKKRLEVQAKITNVVIIYICIYIYIIYLIIFVLFHIANY